MGNIAVVRVDISKIRLLADRMPVSTPMTPGEEMTRECWRAVAKVLEQMTQAIHDLEQADEKARRSR
jgi:hypothetical protein